MTFQCSYFSSLVFEKLIKKGEGTLGMLTIYKENPEILVGKWNGTYHSIWNTSEIIGYRLKQCIFSFPFELSNWY